MLLGIFLILLGGFLYRLLRSEFVLQSKQPLCNDTFSKFVHFDPRAKVYEETIFDSFKGNERREARRDEKKEGKEEGRRRKKQRRKKDTKKKESKNYFVMILLQNSFNLVREPNYTKRRCLIHSKVEKRKRKKIL